MLGKFAEHRRHELALPTYRTRFSKVSSVAAVVLVDYSVAMADQWRLVVSVFLYQYLWCVYTITQKALCQHRN